MLINTRALLWSNPSPPEKKNHTNAPLFHEGLRVSAGHVTSSQKEPITTLPSFLLLLSWAHARTHCQWEAEECWQLFRLDQFFWCRCFALTPRLQLDTRLVSTSPSHMGCTIVKTFWMRLYEWQRNTQFMCVSALFNLTMNLILKSMFSLTALFAICWQFSSISDHTRSYIPEFKSRKKKPHFTPGISICIWINNWNEEKCVTPALLLDLRLLVCLQVWELQESSTIALDAYSYQLQGCNWKMILIMD